MIAIGDIHGCLGQLERLLSLLPPDAPLCFLGDYIDRGLDSKGVIDRVLQLRREREVLALKGNHEDMFLGALDGDPLATINFLRNGGQATLASYGVENHAFLTLPAGHEEFLRSLQTCIETPTHIFVHAGLRPGVPLAHQKEQDLLWIRESFINSDADFGKVVVCGHTPVQSVLVKSNMVRVDTGAFRDTGNGFGRLSAYDTTTGRVWSVF